ncbi:MAG: hypothetical protein V5A16_01495 [Haloplanus sp.]
MKSRLVNSDDTSGLDLVLLGIIAVIVGWYGRTLSVSGNTQPDLIRFFSVSPDRTYAAVLPQDKALLLLSDPATGQATGEVTASAAGSMNGIWTLVVLLGVMSILAGPRVGQPELAATRFGDEPASSRPHSRPCHERRTAAKRPRTTL